MKHQSRGRCQVVVLSRALRSRKPLPLGLVLAACVIVVTGCAQATSGSAVVLDRAEADIPLCGTPEKVPVEELGRTACDMAETRVEFPDGEIRVLGADTASAGFEYVAEGGILSRITLSNFGIYGLAASYRLGDGIEEWWGSPEAVSRGRFLNGDAP